MFIFYILNFRPDALSLLLVACQVAPLLPHYPHSSNFYSWLPGNQSLTLVLKCVCNILCSSFREMEHRYWCASQKESLRNTPPCQMTCHLWIIILVLQWMHGLLTVMQGEKYSGSTLGAWWEERSQELGCIYPLRRTKVLQKYLWTHNTHHFYA